MLDDLTTQIATIYARRKLDLRMVVSYLRDGRGRELVRSTDDRPTTIDVELTNVCQLRCAHCDTQQPAFRGDTGYMSDTTFGQLVLQLRELRPRNLRINGGGEPTLHPKFAEYLYRLHGIAPVISLTTNGLRISESVSRAALRVLDVLEISVASDHGEGYARSRGGADFNRLLGNLATLRSLRDHIGSRTTLQLRVMQRPSEHATTLSLLRFWSRHGDVVTTHEYVEEARYPQCVTPFRALAVGWNGAVPLCRGAALGNIGDTPLVELWRRRRTPELMPICRSCPDPHGRSFVPLAALVRD